jgi:hypothetical protein
MEKISRSLIIHDSMVVQCVGAPLMWDFFQSLFVHSLAVENKAFENCHGVCFISNICSIGFSRRQKRIKMGGGDEETM